VNRSFASLNSQEALHVAIFIEERNAHVYRQFAELFGEFQDTDSLEVASTFWEMAQEERQHGTLLQNVYFQRFGTAPCAVTEEDISEFIEVPSPTEISSLLGRQETANGSPRERALEIALAAENNALEYYRRLSMQTEDTQLRTLYRELAEFEGNHTERLQRKMKAA
jgi:erythrin-vacuolar iron transport family protein